MPEGPIRHLHPTNATPTPFVHSNSRNLTPPYSDYQSIEKDVEESEYSDSDLSDDSIDPDDHQLPPYRPPASPSVKETATASITKRKFEEGARLFVDFFQGTSEPLNLSPLRQPSELSDEMGASNHEYNTLEAPAPEAQAPRTTPSLGRSLSVRSTQKRPSNNRFSFFGLRRNKPEILDPSDEDDELLNLDVDATLSPPAVTTPEMSHEEALNAVQSNAGSVVRRLQAAYRQRTSDLQKVLADKNDKQEEMEETRSLTNNLKVQLDGMADKVFQQEKAMKAMAETLEQDRQAHARRRYSAVSTTKTIPTTDSHEGTAPDDQSLKRSGSKRTSNSTFTSDSGFESGDESTTDSVFSRQGDEREASPVSLTLSSPDMSEVVLSPPGPTPEKEKKTHPTRPARLSAYDKVLKGLASSSIGSLMSHTSKCTICHGVPASEAWTVLGILKEENHGLKGRLVELETTVDECLCVLGP